MDTNFDERQAFEDLQSILNHMYTIANNFYDEAQAAQKVNREKDRIIAELRDDLATLQKNFDSISDKQSDKISELESQLKTQAENFTRHLNEYGDYNVKLTERLENFESDLSEKERNLEGRESDIKRREKILEEDQQNLETEREQFNAEKFSIQKKLDTYDALKKRADNFDNQAQEIHDDYRKELAALKSQHEQDTETIQQLQADKKQLEDDLQNLHEQNEQLNDKIYQLEHST